MTHYAGGTLTGEALDAVRVTLHARSTLTLEALDAVCMTHYAGGTLTPALSHRGRGRLQGLHVARPASSVFVRLPASRVWRHASSLERFPSPSRLRNDLIFA